MTEELHRPRHPAKKPEPVGPSGLHRPQRHVARELTTQAALLGLHHAGKIHYTQGSSRWEGISHHLVAARGHYPNYADCSAYVSWCLWNSLYVRFKRPDVVNGDHWQGGFTGTLAQHGRRVEHIHRTLRGDAVLYGPAPSYEHTAIIVGHRKDGTPVVVSHGSESGPLLLVYNYRPDVGQIRRYI